MDKFSSLRILNLIKFKLRALQAILVLSLRTSFIDRVEWSKATEAISHTKPSLRGFRRNQWQSHPLFFNMNIKVTL